MSPNSQSALRKTSKISNGSSNCCLTMAFRINLSDSYYVQCKLWKAINFEVVLVAIVLKFSFVICIPATH
jgi:hypothetical protein